MGKESVWNISEKPFAAETVVQCQQSLKIFLLPSNVHFWTIPYLKTAVPHMIVLSMQSTTQYTFYSEQIMCTHFFLTHIFRIMFQLFFWSQGENLKLYQLCIFYCSIIISSPASLCTFLRCCLKIYTYQHIHTWKNQMENVTFTFPL